MTGYWGDGGNYQAWVDGLGRWAAGETVDLAALPALEGQDYPPDTWSRLAQHVLEALTTRLTDVLERLTRAAASETDEFAVGRVYAQARHGLRPVRALAAHPALPQDARTKLTETVDRAITSLQEQLEENLDRLAAQPGVDAGLVERRRRTFRDNAFTALLEEPADPAAAASVPWGKSAPPTGASAPADPWSASMPGRRPVRRVITD